MSNIKTPVLHPYFYYDDIIYNLNRTRALTLWCCWKNGKQMFTRLLKI